MDRSGTLRWVVLALALLAMSGWAAAGEATKKDDDAPKKADEPKAKEKGKVAAPEGWVGRVDDDYITREDLKAAQRQIAILNPNTPPPKYELLLDQLIERVLWQRYFEKQGLRATGADVTRAIQQLDNELRQRHGTTYERWIAAMRLTAEEHAGLIAFRLGFERLGQRLQGEVQEEEIKKEFEAHPEHYDGSRIRISQIFIETAEIQHEPDKLKKAKEQVDEIYAKLQGGEDFEKLARTYSDRVTSLRGGEEGWFLRKSVDQQGRIVEENEPLLKAAWALKVGEFTKPIQGSRGWHIIKVTDKEPAYLTPFGARRNVIGELVRKRVQSILDEQKAKATIERRL
ncbi:MAG: hypothetical protein FJ290_07150 [Planctomycetes bacterium]|nr:hypothetical protein [Planctomycetota bacterium]